MTALSQNGLFEAKSENRALENQTAFSTDHCATPCWVGPHTPRQRLASAGGRRQAAGPPVRMAPGDGEPARLGDAAGGPEPNVMRLLAHAPESLARGRLAQHFLLQGEPGPQRRARRPPQAVGPWGNDYVRHGFVFHCDARERQHRHSRYAKHQTCESQSGGQRRPRADKEKA
jgi:hypothetical protein